MIHKLVHGDRSSVRRVEEEGMEEDRYDDKSMKRSKARRKSMFLKFFKDFFFFSFSFDRSRRFYLTFQTGKRTLL